MDRNIECHINDLNHAILWSRLAGELSNVCEIGQNIVVGDLYALGFAGAAGRKHNVGEVRPARAEIGIECFRGNRQGADAERALALLIDRQIGLRSDDSRQHRRVGEKVVDFDRAAVVNNQGFGLGFPKDHTVAGKWIARVERHVGRAGKKSAGNCDIDSVGPVRKDRDPVAPLHSGAPKQSRQRQRPIAKLPIA